MKSPNVSKINLQDDTYQIDCLGGAGQSFGAFIPKGLTMRVEGDANDYFGKGLSGGKLIIHPSPNAQFVAQDNVIVGNVASLWRNIRRSLYRWTCW